MTITYGRVDGGQDRQRDMDRAQAREEKDALTASLRNILYNETGTKLDERKFNLLFYVLGEDPKNVFKAHASVVFYSDMLHQRGYREASIPRNLIDLEGLVVTNRTFSPERDKVVNRVVEAIASLNQPYELLSNPEEAENEYRYLGFYLPRSRKLVFATNEKNNSIYFIHIPEGDESKPSDYIHRSKKDLRLMELEGIVTYLDNNVAPVRLARTIASELKKPNPSLVGKDERTPDEIIQRERNRMLQLDDDDDVYTETYLIKNYHIEQALRPLLQRLAEAHGMSINPAATNTIWRYATDSLNRVVVCIDPVIGRLAVEEIEAENSKTWSKEYEVLNRFRRRGLKFSLPYLKQVLEELADTSPDDRKYSRKRHATRSKPAYLYRERLILKALRRIERENTFVSLRDIWRRCQDEGVGIRINSLRDFINAEFGKLNEDLQTEYRAKVGSYFRFSPEFADLIVEKVRELKASK